ncbi:hypothetical protein PISMIDRAFT_448165 [Pisolithus microcarpus 441]|uniref:Uncharacterized protein n=1 Tax=Pisolithus microcarpus 441 TaxID=765257 RepID=A0A0C9ZKY7_9AGAM|nr:hypothetical protein PISMIDRAFT_448165 [Pisolithus microcarpus 441]
MPRVAGPARTVLSTPPVHQSTGTRSAHGTPSQVMPLSNDGALHATLSSSTRMPPGSSFSRKQKANTAASTYWITIPKEATNARFTTIGMLCSAAVPGCHLANSSA